MVRDTGSGAGVRMRSRRAAWALIAAAVGAIGSCAAARAAGEPQSHVLTCPAFDAAEASWGATGKDAQGRIWIGLSARMGEGASAHLYRYEPDSGQCIGCGDVLSQLDRLGLLRPGEAQMKIHTKLVQADDGYLYFASVDDLGMDPNTLQLPIWGSHLWRIDPGDCTWEHLAGLPEGLIALAGGGKWIYAFGYFGHVLYRFDTESRDLLRIDVGSVGSHVSRNIFCDAKGHVYAPRVQPGAGPNSFLVELVEFDTALQERAAHPLEFYGATADLSSQGITGFTHLQDGSIAFVTQPGHLYRVTPHDAAPSELVGLGWLDDPGDYVPSMFTPDGGSTLVGLLRQDGEFSGLAFQWYTRDLVSGQTLLEPFLIDGKEAGRSYRFYGSETADSAAGMYLVGYFGRAGVKTPVLLRVVLGQAGPELGSGWSLR